MIFKNKNLSNNIMENKTASQKRKETILKKRNKATPIDTKITNLRNEITFKQGAEGAFYGDLIKDLYDSKQIQRKDSVFKLYHGLLGFATEKSRNKKPSPAIKKNTIKTILSYKKDYMITANINITEIYQGDLDKNGYELDMKNHRTGNIDKFVVKRQYDITEEKAKQFTAFTEQEALKSFVDEAILEYTYTDSGVYSYYVSMDTPKITYAKASKGKKIEDMKMKDARPLNYNSVLECKKYLTNKLFIDETDSDGYCVIKNLLGIYSEQIKSFKLDMLINTCTEYYKGNWDIKDGVCSKCISVICEKFNIPMYAFDFNTKCFMKNVVPKNNQNYDALIYFAIDNHMYLIKDKKTCKSLVEKAKDIKCNVASVLLDQDEVKNIFKDVPLLENIPIKDLINYDSNIIMYSREDKNNLNDLFGDVIRCYNIIPSNISSNKSAIHKFEFCIGEKKFILVEDPNDIINIDYKRIKELCDKYQIEFKNQSFTTFINTLKIKFIDEKNGRKHFNQDERNDILILGNNQCNQCKKGIKKHFEIDHIMPLAQGGNNDIKNLQILCKGCHQEKTRNEHEAGAYNNKLDTFSSFNCEVLAVMNSDFSKSFAFIETIGENPYFGPDINVPVYYFDINKCRSNILRFSRFDFCLFTVMDKIEPYRNQHGAGVYYIESSNYFPLRGNGWYYYPMVEYCLTNNIIAKSDIKYCIISGLTIPKDYYTEFIEYVYKNMNDKAKLAINSMIGAFNININKNVKWTTELITRDIDLAFEPFLNDNGCFIKQFDLDKVDSEFSGDTNNTFYQVFKSYESKKLETEAPIYNQIIQMENIELHKLAMIIEDNYGTVLDLKTDCVACWFNCDGIPFKLLDEINIKGYYWDKEKKYPKYKLENGQRLKFGRMEKWKRNEQFKYEPKEWTLFNDGDRDQLRDTIISSGKSCNIDGLAGTGKTYLINDIKEELDRLGLKYICLAPTNKSAQLIKGKTLHKWINSMKTQKNINNLDVEYIFVDEISMVSEYFYKHLMIVKQLRPNIKFILSGDFEQLKPINDRIGEDFDYKNSMALFELCDGNRVQLTKCYRADKDFFDMYHPNNIKNIDVKVFGNTFAERHICYTNDKRIEVNKQVMDKKFEPFKELKALLEEKQILRDRKKSMKSVNEKIKQIHDTHGVIEYLEIPKKLTDASSQDVILMVGTPIIAKVNKMSKKDIDNGISFANNEEFIITKIDGDKIYLDNDCIIDKDTFQNLFNVAYCITTHKSQGQSYDFPYTIHEWNKFTDCMRYVALSRSKNIKHINII
jgi:5-methylcytosine-specific restriction protein A